MNNDSPKTAQQMPPPASPRDTGKLHGQGQDMGNALRSVYQKTVDEAVPDEFLDLLSKLD